ncbi:hypothetical protein Dsin_003639 [Dipteronia sinensis]|uniref:Uncharacterized protein n=1 Tax=Dipteronia sinensis TaxID=43782 RepID=A0AAE0EKF7_9ROSI|nr:hypothetical protein Dsin_003639 [Dipteronia sinensis]
MKATTTKIPAGWRRQRRRSLADGGDDDEDPSWRQRRRGDVVGGRSTVSGLGRVEYGIGPNTMTAMEGRKGKGYAWAFSAGLNAALAAVSAKFFSSQVIKYGLVILFNVTMWGCYVNSLKALSSLQATVTNFATNFLSSGLAGFFLFEEALSFQVLYKLRNWKLPVNKLI